MKHKSLIFIAIILAIAFASAQLPSQVLDLEININQQDSIKVSTVSLGGPLTPVQSDKGAYILQLINANGKQVYLYKFDPIFVICAEGPSGANCSELDSYSFEVIAPYTTAIDSMIIKKGDKVIFTQKNIKKLLCDQDNQCNNFENYLSCPSDCKANANDGVCNSRYLDGVCDEDCFFDVEGEGDCNAIQLKMESINYVGANNVKNSVDLSVMNAVTSYCETDGILKAKKQSGRECINNYECESNVCADGFCQAVTGKTTGAVVSESPRAGIITKAICAIESIFGKNYDSCLGGVNNPITGQATSMNDCNFSYAPWKVTWTGTSDKIAKVNGNDDGRFICFDKKIKACGWDVTLDGIEDRKDGEIFGSWKCKLDDPTNTRGGGSWNANALPAPVPTPTSTPMPVPQTQSAGNCNGGNYLITDTSNDRIMELDASKNIFWQYDVPNASSQQIALLNNLGSFSVDGPWAAVKLDNGNYLISDTGNHIVVEVNSAKQIVWQYGTGSSGSGANQLSFPVYANRLVNGNTLISEWGNRRVIEVNANNQIVWQYGANGPRTVQRLGNGNTLISDVGDHIVVEVNSAKQIVWQYGIKGTRNSGSVGLLNNPYSAVRLGNGNTLITDSTRNRVIEVNANNQIVWQYGKDGVRGSAADLLFVPSSAIRLTSGNTLISDRSNNRIIEVNANNQIVWQYGTSIAGKSAERLKYPSYVGCSAALAPVPTPTSTPMPSKECNATYAPWKVTWTGTSDKIAKVNGNDENRALCFNGLIKYCGWDVPTSPIKDTIELVENGNQPTGSNWKCQFTGGKYNNGLPVGKWVSISALAPIPAPETCSGCVVPVWAGYTADNSDKCAKYGETLSTKAGTKITLLEGGHSNFGAGYLLKVLSSQSSLKIYDGSKTEREYALSKGQAISVSQTIGYSA